ncbi:hypothetical protein EVAR_91298_1 [Eumeta japonica]|uniref:Uncharacterized protein n=1 Tax=Eumeta variegata TaxID=151549 RepID=A0A4C1TAA7_EUMVA|nr:hypothetical protein EVAR_91298_1 [Eumeta japonica]
MLLTYLKIFGTKSSALEKTVEEFNKLIPVAQEILERRSPSPNQYIIPEVENQIITCAIRDSTVTVWFGGRAVQFNKKHYLKRRSTDKLRELITTCKQSIKEPASKFGERLDALLSESLGNRRRVASRPGAKRL